jgi:hypothetical protein
MELGFFMCTLKFSVLGVLVGIWIFNPVIVENGSFVKSSFYFMFWIATLKGH